MKGCPEQFVGDLGRTSKSYARKVARPAPPLAARPPPGAPPPRPARPRPSPHGPAPPRTAPPRIMPDPDRTPQGRFGPGQSAKAGPEPVAAQGSSRQGRDECRRGSLAGRGRRPVRRARTPQTGRAYDTGGSGRTPGSPVHPGTQRPRRGPGSRGGRRRRPWAGPAPPPSASAPGGRAPSTCRIPVGARRARGAQPRLSPSPAAVTGPLLGPLASGQMRGPLP